MAEFIYKEQIIQYGNIVKERAVDPDKEDIAKLKVSVDSLTGTWVNINKIPTGKESTTGKIVKQVQAQF